MSEDNEFAGINTPDNRRKYLRARIDLKGCVLKVKSIDEETGERTYHSCFHSSLADISEGGLCIAHKNNLMPGDLIEFRTKNFLTMKRCLKCPFYFDVEPVLSISILTGKVVWRTKRRAGIEFIALTADNKQKIAKYVWTRMKSNIKSPRD